MQSIQIGVYDAKNRLSELIREVVSTGKGVTITVNGEAKVDIVPAVATAEMTWDQAKDMILNRGGAAPRSGITSADILDDLHQGRRS